MTRDDIEFAEYLSRQMRPHEHRNILLSFSELLSKVAPPEFLVDNFIEKDTTGLFFGDPGSYKSFMALDIALSVATGKDWQGNKVKKAPVVYVAGEGHGGLARRSGAWLKHNPGLSPDYIQLYFSSKAADFYNREAALGTSELIKETVKDVPPGLVIIDTLARNCGAGDENSTSDMNIFIENLDELIRQKYGCAVLIVHHTGHANKKRARGAMALKGAVDFEYRIEKHPGLMARLVCTKMKDAIEPPETWFKGKPVLLDMEEDISSLVFDKVEGPGKGKRPLMGDRGIAFDLLRNMTDSQGQVSRFKLREAAEKAGLDSPTLRRKLAELRKKGLIEYDKKLVTMKRPLSFLDEVDVSKDGDRIPYE